MEVMKMPENANFTYDENKKAYLYDLNQSTKLPKKLEELWPF